MRPAGRRPGTWTVTPRIPRVSVHNHPRAPRKNCAPACDLLRLSGRRSAAAVMAGQAPRPRPGRRPVPAPPAGRPRRSRAARDQVTRGGGAARSRSRRCMQGRGRPGRRWRLVGPDHDRGVRRPADPRGGWRRGGYGRQDRGDRRGNRGVGGRRAGHGVTVAAQHDRERDGYAGHGQDATGHDGARAEAHLFHAGVERALQLTQTWSPPSLTT